MTSASLEALLREHMGLDIQSIGEKSLQRAIEERQRATASPSEQSYLTRVSSDDAELQELVEAVIVPETWFFREREAFSALTRVALESWLTRDPARFLRLLSMPCSSGEEPYSLAMALLDAGLSPASFSIDALDISSRSLAKARSGLYRSNSFRGADLSFRERHFRANGPGTYLLSAEVRSTVSFAHGNFLEPGLLQRAPPYDVVFCRNLLIYLEPSAQERVLRALVRLTAPDGLLFVGPSETTLFLQGGFEPLRVPQAFAFRRLHDGEALRPSERKIASEPTRPLRGLPRAPAQQVNAPVVAAAQASARALRLEDAQRLADQGQLGDAELVCREHLRLHGPSAHAFHLLALLSEAAGNVEAAIEQHRKTLYLEPDHHEALLHLALLLQKRGDIAGAERLRRRAARSPQGGAS